jgi:hypothetical protein
VTLLIGAAFDHLFATFERTAFRLEVRESYGGVDYERSPLRRFLAGEPEDMAYLRPWLDNVRVFTAAGRRMSRVRVVSEPHSDYTRFALRNCRYNIEAGENIRYLGRDQAADLPSYDWWLFDDDRLYLMHFSDADEFLGAEQVTDADTVAAHRGWRDLAWLRATPYTEYVERSTGAEQRTAGT